MFDDVATKAFAIPAGVWLATSKIEPASVGTIEFYKNLTFIFVVFVLAVFVTFNLRGQFSSLKAIREEYKPLFQRLSDEDGSDREEVVNVVTELEKRDDSIWWKLVISQFVTIVMFIIVILLVCASVAPPP